MGHPNRLHDRLLWGLLIGVGVAVAAWAGWSKFGSSENDPPADPLRGHPVADFSFTDQRGRTITQETLKGKVWICNVFFTCCDRSCPHMGRALAELQRDLRATDVLFVSISVDAVHDTPEVIREYASRYKADPARWLFLIADAKDKDRVNQFTEKSFYARAVENANEPPGNRFAHSSRLILIDRQGKVFGSYAAVQESLTEAGKSTGTFNVDERELTRLRRDAEKLAKDTAP